MGQKLDGIAIMPIQSIAAAATAFVGQNMGANKPERVKKGTKAGTYVIKLKANVKGTANYNAIKNSISVPTIKVQTPDREEVSSMWSQVLRPATDAAIAKRNEAAREDMAELDADAVSRGMGSSSYVTSVKAREMEEAQDDISEMEAQYSAMLAERIYDTLSRYEQMNYSAQQYNAEAAAAAEKTALAMASDWYNSYLAQQKATAEKKSSGSSSSSSSKKSGLSAADYTEYVRNLTPAQQKLLFTSGEQYWSSRRDEIYSALGSTLYENLKKQYGGK